MTAQQLAGTTGRAVAGRLARRARRWVLVLLALVVLFAGAAFGAYQAVSSVVDRVTPDVAPVVQVGHDVADWADRARRLIPGGAP